MEEKPSSASDQQAQLAHWTKSRNLTFAVLAIWFLFGFIIPWHAKGLNELSFLGFPLGYYFIVQGSLIVFVALIFAQNKIQDNIDAEFGISEEMTEDKKEGTEAQS